MDTREALNRAYEMNMRHVRHRVLLITLVTLLMEAYEATFGALDASYELIYGALDDDNEFREELRSVRMDYADLHERVMNECDLVMKEVCG